MVRFEDAEEDEGEPRPSGTRLAPVIPLFGGAAGGVPSTDDRRRTPGADDMPIEAWHRSWLEASGEPSDAPAAVVDAPQETLAERTLLKKLRTRSLSAKEARAVAVGNGLDAEGADELIASFARLGYLDDAALASQLVFAAVERKGHGRQVIAQTLAKRGIPREVADAALAELPDDDAERALEFARQKVRSMRSLDRDAALRRLHGQLARRGFPGSVAMSAARQALDEGGTSGVTFR